MFYLVFWEKEKKTSIVEANAILDDNANVGASETCLDAFKFSSASFFVIVGALYPSAARATILNLLYSPNIAL